jgi:hypothetical protein
MRVGLLTSWKRLSRKPNKKSDFGLCAVLSREATHDSTEPAIREIDMIIRAVTILTKADGSVERLTSNVFTVNVRELWEQGYKAIEFRANINDSMELGLGTINLEE